MPRRDDDKPLHIPLTADQYETVRMVAHKSGVSMNEFAREALRLYVKQSKYKWPDDDRRTWTPPANGG